MDSQPWRPALPASAPSVHGDALLRLSSEIIDFSDQIRPFPDEHTWRSDVVSRLSFVVRSLWSRAQVTPFGSFASGLYLPSSDIDVVVLHSGVHNTTAALATLAAALQRMDVAADVRVVAQARVPIVKFTDKISGISVDVSFDSITGVQAVYFMQETLQYFPSFEPVYLVLKFFLKQKGLNEVYRTGGLNSFTLFVMLLMHIQTNGGRRSPGYSHWDEFSNLGLVLIDFFDFYGRRLNVREDGISCRDGGYIFKKAAWGFMNPRRPNLLAIEHPQIPGTDIGKNSFNFENIRLAFRQAHRLLYSVYHGRDRVLHQLFTPLEADEDTLVDFVCPTTPGFILAQ